MCLSVRVTDWRNEDHLYPPHLQMQGPHLHGVGTPFVLVEALGILPVLPVDIEQETCGKLARQLGQQVLFQVAKKLAAILEDAVEAVPLGRSGGGGEEGLEVEDVVSEKRGAAEDLENATSGALLGPIVGHSAEPSENLARGEGIE